MSWQMERSDWFVQLRGPTDVQGTYRSYSTVGLEQALAPVQEPDTSAEGAWDKLPKTEGTFDFKLSLQFLLDLLENSTVCSSYVRKWAAKFLAFINDSLYFNFVVC